MDLALLPAVFAFMPQSDPVLLVGASGRIGRMICHHWRGGATAAKLIPTRRLPSPDWGGVIWSPLEGPRVMLDQLDRIGKRPAAMVVLAGVTPASGQSGERLQDNARLAEACLAAAHAAGIARVLLASSSAVYGLDPASKPFCETTAPRPIAPYGQAKLTMEASARPWRDKGTNVCALRIGNVAGADALLGPLTARTPVTTDQPGLRIDAFDDGLGPLRSYIGALTLTRVLASLAQLPSPLPDVLNLAAPHPVRMTALAQAAGWPFSMTPAAPGAHQQITLDCGRLKGLVPMSPADSLPAQMVQQWKATWPQ